MTDPTGFVPDPGMLVFAVPDPGAPAAVDPTGFVPAAAALVFAVPGGTPTPSPPGPDEAH
jgi:hypothetical protein